MVSQSTQDFVTGILDYQLDYNIKLIIFGCLIFYAFLLYYMTRKLEVDSFAKLIFNLFAKIYVYATGFFLPLFTIMLFREYAAISLWTLVLQMYGVIFVITALALVVFGWQKVLEMFNLPSDIGMLQRERKRKGEE